MNTDNLVFRTVFVDRDVDAEVLLHAGRKQVSAGSIYRLFLETGLAQLAKGSPLPAIASAPTVMRAVHVQVESDDMLTGLACHLNMDKGELTSRVTRQGMLLLQAALEARPQSPPA